MKLKKKSASHSWIVLSLGGLAALATALAFTAGKTTQTNAISDNGKYYPDYSTIDEALSAAGDLNEQLAEEGDVLLKNDGSLPFEGNERVSVFGIHSDNFCGGSDITMPEALRSAGFRVNPTLEKFYADDNSGTTTSGPSASASGFDDEAGYDKTSDTFALKSSVGESVNAYNDIGVIVVSRTGGEGADLPRKVPEEATAEDIATHKALATSVDEQGVTHTYKHYLMLSQAERAMIKYVEKKCKHVVVVVDSSNAMELNELKKDDKVNGVLWIGRPGEKGLNAVGKILKGEVNPSGHLVDEYPADLTADPTWVNFGDNSQVGDTNTYLTAKGATYYVNEPLLNKGGDATFTGTDYEEDVYLGYRYYETYYEDLYASDPAKASKWYEDHVAYAFGEGLSYSKFAFEIKGLYTDQDLATGLGDNVAGTQFDSSVDASGAKQTAKVKKIYVPVKVTNTGSFAGKQTVQVYVKAPYKKGGIAKGVHDLVGYGKSKTLRPGASEVVTVSFNVEDMAAWDYKDANADNVKGDYELDAGAYTVRAMASSHVDLATPIADREAYAEKTFTLDTSAHMHLDDFSGEELHNLFTTADQKYVGTGYDGKTLYNSLRTADMMKDGADAETLMSRDDFDGTFPEAVKTTTIAGAGENGNDVTANGLIFTDEVYAMWEAFRTPRVDYQPTAAVDTSSDGIRNYQKLEDKTSDPWYVNAVPNEWTQAASADKRTITIKAAAMAGLSYDDPKWVDFMNQLTYDELTGLFTNTRASTPAIAAIGKASSIDQDGPNNFDNLYQWCDEVVIASTWNVDLGNAEGQIVGSMGALTGNTGWYGPGMDFHRSAFAGRNNEYYSQDGIQGGYMAAAVVRGAQAKGMNAMIKHLAFNDQETNRGGMSNMVWASEQVIRQQELKMFTMAIQEGGALAGMSGYGRICGVVNQSNYRLNTNYLQDEIGWHGFMITDGFLGMRWCTTIDIMMRAGNQIVYRTEPWYDAVSGGWDATLRGGKGDASVGGAENLIQYYYARKNAKSVLYSTINSNANKNGFTDLALTGGALSDAQAGVTYNASVAIDPLTLGDSSCAYSIAEGALPSGLALDASTGAVTGTTTVEGAYSFTVKALIDNSVSKTAVYTLNVKSAFALVEGSDALDSAKVGAEFFAQYSSSVFTTEGGKYDTVTYAMDSGTLVPGLAVSADGKITGTPTQAGTFAFSIKMTATKTEAGSSGGAGSTKTTTLSFNVTITVAAADNPKTDPTSSGTSSSTPTSSTPTSSATASSSQATSSKPTSSSTVTPTSSATSSAGGSTSKGGCGGSIIGGSIAGSIAIVGLATALIIRKKKKN